MCKEKEEEGLGTRERASGEEPSPPRYTGEGLWHVLLGMLIGWTRPLPALRP